MHWPIPAVIDTISRPLAAASKSIALIALGILVDFKMQARQLRSVFELLGAHESIAYFLLHTTYIITNY
jgi:hypothetical protein